MANELTDLLLGKQFSTWVRVCVYIHYAFTIGLTAFFIALNDVEPGKFNCYLASDSTATFKAQVDKACYTRYQQNYESPVPFIYYVIPGIWFTTLITLLYSISVRKRVAEIESNNEVVHAQRHSRGTLYIFYCYFYCLVFRVLSGVLFVILKYALFPPNGFDFKFTCRLPPTENTPIKTGNVSINDEFFTCENPVASNKNTAWIIVIILYIILVTGTIFEVFRLCRRYPNCRCTIGNQWSCDDEFVMDHFFGRSLELVRLNLQECIEFYKSQVLQHPRLIDGSYAKGTDVDETYTDLVVHTE